MALTAAEDAAGQPELGLVQLPPAPGCPEHLLGEGHELLEAADAGQDPPSHPAGSLGLLDLLAQGPLRTTQRRGTLRSDLAWWSTGQETRQGAGSGNTASIYSVFCNSKECDIPCLRLTWSCATGRGYPGKFGFPHPWRCPRNTWVWHSELWSGDKAGIKGWTLILEGFPKFWNTRSLLRAQRGKRQTHNKPTQESPKQRKPSKRGNIQDRNQRNLQVGSSESTISLSTCISGPPHFDPALRRAVRRCFLGGFFPSSSPVAPGEGEDGARASFGSNRGPVLSH